MSASLQPALTTTRKSVLAPRDHQVVEDAAGGIGEEGVALPARRQADDVDRHQRLERRRGVVAASRTWPMCGRRTAPPPRPVPVFGGDALRDSSPACRSRRRAPSWRGEFEVQGVQRVFCSSVSDMIASGDAFEEAFTSPGAACAMPGAIAPLSAPPEIGGAPLPAHRLPLWWTAPGRASSSEERRALRGACQSFCLSVRTRPKVGSAPSAASRGNSLLARRGVAGAADNRHDCCRQMVVGRGRSTWKRKGVAHDAEGKGGVHSRRARRARCRVTVQHRKKNNRQATAVAWQRESQRACGHENATLRPLRRLWQTQHPHVAAGGHQAARWKTRSGIGR